MLQSSIPIVPLVARSLQRVVHALPWMATAASLRAEALETGFGSPFRSVTARVVQLLRDIAALARDNDGASRPRGEEALRVELATARANAADWRIRAEIAEEHLAILEARLATSEMAALELRSRVVCLHGKLATSTATARYQSLTLALEQRPRPVLMAAEAADEMDAARE